MATPKQRFTAALNQVIRRFDRLEASTVRDMVRLLVSFRKDVRDLLAELPTGDRFNTLRLSGLRDDIDDLIVQLEGQLIATTQTGIRDAAELGLQSVTSPIAAAGVTTFYNRPSMSQINTLVDFSADLVKRVTADMRGKINTEITRIALGAISPFQAQKNLTEILGIRAGRQVVKGVGHAAERIIRTEVNRSFNVSNFAQMQEVEEVTPDARKRWNATGDMRTRDPHINAHGQLQPISKPFIVGGEKLMYPLDPAGSAKNTINCRCRMTVIHPDIGVIGGPLDGQIGRERKRRKE